MKLMLKVKEKDCKIKLIKFNVPISLILIIFFSINFKQAIPALNKAK